MIKGAVCDAEGRACAISFGDSIETVHDSERPFPQIEGVLIYHVLNFCHEGTPHK